MFKIPATLHRYALSSKSVEFYYKDAIKKLFSGTLSKEGKQSQSVVGTFWITIVTMVRMTP